MLAVWRLGLILLGFAIATLAAAVVSVPSAHAQSSASDYQRAPYSTTPAKPRPEPNPALDSSDPPSAYETQPRRLLRGTADGDVSDGEVDAETEQTDDTDADADLDPLSRRGAGNTDGTDQSGPTDGDLSSPAEQLADGEIDLADPVPPQDGADLNADVRPQEDLDIFNQPPAGYDPLLFQIEDIDPILTDRRPERLYRFEPYDPVGMKIGSFVYFPEVEIAGSATDNVLSSPDARSDAAIEILTTQRLVSNWSMHAIELKGTTTNSFHDEFSSEDDKGYSVEARGRLDLRRRTNFQGLVGRSVAQESRSGVDASQTGERADVTTNNAELAFNHRFNRVSVHLRGSVADTTYSDTNGASNRDRDVLETRETVRAAYEFKPTLSVFAEQELNQREKETPPPDGIPRDSDGLRTRVGLDFGATGAVLRGEVSLGYGQQETRNSRLSPVDMLLFDANLAWRPTEITSLLLTARSDIYDTTTSNSGGVAAQMAGIEVRHAFRRYLIASAGLIYTNYNYSGVELEESELTSFLLGEYYASPEVVLFARYEHVDYDSTTANADYDSDEVRIGVRLRR